MSITDLLATTHISDKWRKHWKLAGILIQLQTVAVFSRSNTDIVSWCKAWLYCTFVPTFLLLIRRVMQIIRIHADSSKKLGSENQQK